MVYSTVLSLQQCQKNVNLIIIYIYCFNYLSTGVSALANDVIYICYSRARPWRQTSPRSLRSEPDYIVIADHFQPSNLVNDKLSLFTVHETIYDSHNAKNKHTVGSMIRNMTSYAKRKMHGPTYLLYTRTTGREFSRAMNTDKCIARWLNGECSQWWESDLHSCVSNELLAAMILP